jgi:DNA-binding transcriptional regulator PaaX
MSRPLSGLSKEILVFLQSSPAALLSAVYSEFEGKNSKKEIYNTIYRLADQELLSLEGSGKDKTLKLTGEGEKSILKHNPKRDGIWKIIVFDIPESKRSVRNFIRGKLRALGFKKWQNSIWVSPYELDSDLEKELSELAKKIFIRLIKTTDINYTEDLEKLF